MKRGVIIAGVLFALALLLGRPAPSWAGIHQVWDEAHFFNVQTIEHVNQVLQDIHGRFEKDLMIETFPSIPDDFKDKLQEQGKDKFFDGWSSAEGRRLELNGVLILITGDPAHLEVKVGLETRKKAFTQSDATELADQLVTAFKAKDFDGGITRAAEFVRDRMAKNLGKAAAPTSRPTTQPDTGSFSATTHAGPTTATTKPDSDASFR
ncbi:MAG TPA: TPM domain-containing protein [Tepidisphaeraceae bacterium]|nr:TPM domain-containing protein [Tepidisphaeraceae bacterium]